MISAVFQFVLSISLLFASGAALPTDRTDQTIVSADTLAGIDLQRLQVLIDEIRNGTQYPDIHSLIVWRGGVTVAEEYFSGSSATHLHTLQSVTKSFASAAIGLAIDDGGISDVDELVIDFFPDSRQTLAQNTRRAAMRLDDVLTMRTGTDYHESGSSSPHFQLNALSTGWDDFWLARPMVNDPGSFWRYDSGGVIALSSMIKNRYGIHADDFLEERLLTPLGIDATRWTRNAEQHPHTGGGLFMRARDLLKFGQLYLQDGVWEGNQLLSKEWVDASLQRHQIFSTPRGGSGKAIGYGYLWWVLEPDPAGDQQELIYAALGFRGQCLFIIPEHDMVVVVTSWMPPAQQSKPILFLYSDILPSVVAPFSVSTHREIETPQTHTIQSVFPHPIQQRASVEFLLDQPTYVDIEIYDTLGRRIQSSPLGYLPAGTQSQSIDVSELSSGAYSLGIRTSQGYSFRSIVVLP